MDTHTHPIYSRLKRLEIGQTHTAPRSVPFNKEVEGKKKPGIVRYHNGPAFEMVPTEAGLEFKRVR